MEDIKSQPIQPMAFKRKKVQSMSVEIQRSILAEMALQIGYLNPLTKKREKETNDT